MQEPRYFVPNEQAAHTRLKVLIIDAIQRTRIVTSKIMESKGFDVIVAKSHVEAMRVMNKECKSIHFVISNIKQGFEASDQIRKCGYDKPIVYYTENNIKAPSKLQLFPDSTSVQPISTRNNLWVIRKS